SIPRSCSATSSGAVLCVAERCCMFDSQLLVPTNAHICTCRRHEMPMTKIMPIKAFIGYLSSWSGYVTYRKQNPEAADPLVELQEQRLRVLDKSEDEEVAVSWPLFLLLGRAK